MALCVVPTTIILNGFSYDFLVSELPGRGSVCSNYVALTATEFSDLQLSASNNLFQLSADDGALIAGAVLALWAAAFGIRTLIGFLKSS